GSDPPESTVAWARRALATVLAKSRPPRFAEALELLESGQPSENDRLAAQVVKARLLAGRPYRSDRLEAVAILDQVHAREKLGADERLLLAELLDTLGQTQRAGELWTSLVNENPTSAQLLVPYLRRQ